MEYFVKTIQPFVPTLLIRLAIRAYLSVSTRRAVKGHVIKQLLDVVNKSRLDDVTILADKANEQHYEVPTSFFKKHLGPRLKYSSCEWPIHINTLAEAETATLRSYQNRAGLDQLNEGSTVLEMGSGWGSLSLLNAMTYPKLKFISFSNSTTQVEYIKKMIHTKKIQNLDVFVEDYQDFCSTQSTLHGQTVDRIIAIETIEHARNIERLFEWMSYRLKDKGCCFIQSLVLQHHAYMVSHSDWMGRNFFSGGQMLAAQSYLHYNKHLIVRSMEPRSGLEYARTLATWLTRLENLKKTMIDQYGQQHYEQFRMFYMQCTEAFAIQNGSVYMTCYYNLEKRK